MSSLRIDLQAKITLKLKGFSLAGPSLDGNNDFDNVEGDRRNNDEPATEASIVNGGPAGPNNGLRKSRYTEDAPGLVFNDNNGNTMTTHNTTTTENTKPHNETVPRNFNGRYVLQHAVRSDTPTESSDILASTRFASKAIRSKETEIVSKQANGTMAPRSAARKKRSKAPGKKKAAELARALEPEPGDRNVSVTKTKGIIQAGDVVASIETTGSTALSDRYTTGNEKSIPEDVCVEPGSYVWPIRIYKCLKKPDTITFSLAMWEQRHGIATLMSAEDDEESEHIPNGAIYIIVAEQVLINPIGPVLFFAEKVDEDLPTEHYRPVVGQYYAYDESILPWFDEYTAPMSPFPLIEPHKIVRNEGSLAKGHTHFYRSINLVVNAEYAARPYRARFLRTPDIFRMSLSVRRRDRVLSKRHIEVLGANGITLDDLKYEPEQEDEEEDRLAEGDRE